MLFRDGRQGLSGGKTGAGVGDFAAPRAGSCPRPATGTEQRAGAGRERQGLLRRCRECPGSQLPDSLCRVPLPGAGGRRPAAEPWGCSWSAAANYAGQGSGSPAWTGHGGWNIAVSFHPSRSVEKNNAAGPGRQVDAPGTPVKSPFPKALPRG